MNLAEHWDGTDYLQPGWHTVRVVECKVRQILDKQAVEITVKADGGKQTRGTFWITEKAVWKLASFAKACGLSKEEGRQYDPLRESCHRVLIGRSVNVEVYNKDGKYSTFDEFEQVESNQPAAVSNPASMPLAPITTPASEFVEPVSAANSMDDIPF